MKLGYLILILCITPIAGYTQDNCVIATYNILNYPGNDTTARNPNFRIVIRSVNPDILVVQEILSQDGVDGFLSNVMNTFGETYAAGIFINGYNTDNAIFYKTSKFTFLSNTPIETELRDINEFILVHTNGIDTVRLYTLHLKASQGTTNEEKRAREVDSLRKVLDTLHTDANYLVIGDFNIYVSSELAYQKLLDQTNSGYVVDPIDRPGNWHNNISFADIHTQSPRTRQFGGGAPGGMDDRFDMILVSANMIGAGGGHYIDSSYISYGNDGNHFNDSLNAPPNTAVTQEIANAIHYASDHLPLFATFRFDGPTSIASNEIIPETPMLYQNYPNPFNPSTKIKYQISVLSYVTLKVYDLLGNEIATLVSEEEPIGSYEVEFNGTNLSSGIYFYQLKSGIFIETMKMMLMK